jgi:hypothetical protein
MQACGGIITGDYDQLLGRQAWSCSLFCVQQHVEALRHQVLHLPQEPAQAQMQACGGIMTGDYDQLVQRHDKCCSLFCVQQSCYTHKAVGQYNNRPSHRLQGSPGRSPAPPGTAPATGTCTGASTQHQSSLRHVGLLAAVAGKVQQHVEACETRYCTCHRNLHKHKHAAT